MDLTADLIVKLTDSLNEAHNELLISINEGETLAKLAGKLDLIETDIAGIRDFLNRERTALKELKSNLAPVAGFFSTSKKPKSVNFAVSPPIKSASSESVNHLTPQEFETLPKYLKGRLTVAKINSFIDDFNRFVEEKYSLLSRANPAKLSLDQRQRFMEWKQAEVEETCGKFFITEADLKAKSASSSNNGFKYDQVSRNILTILRQVGRVRELRSPGGIIRYIIN